VTDWDDLPAAKRAEITALRQRTHGSVAGEHRLALEDMRAATFGDACDWLAANGHADAAVALEAAVFPSGPTP
jgi:hypothetical protein